MPLPVLEDPRSGEQFLHELREQLHTMAQPLTFLQTRLEAALLLQEHNDPASLAALLFTLSGAVERACENFHCLQLLASSALREHKNKAHCASGKNA